MVVAGVDLEALSEEERSELLAALAHRSVVDSETGTLTKEQEALLKERARAYFAGESEVVELEDVLGRF